MEQLLQETGRAGRDNNLAYCTIFFRTASIYRRIQLIAQTRDVMQAKRQLQELRKVVSFCREQFACRRLKLLAPYGDYGKKNCDGNCDNCEFRVVSIKKFKETDITPFACQLLELYRARGLPSSTTHGGISTGTFVDLAYEEGKTSDGRKFTKSTLRQIITHMFQEGVFDFRQYRRTEPKTGSVYYLIVRYRFKCFTLQTTENLNY